MADGDEDPPDPDEGAVLSPEELDITDEQSVKQIDEGRFVISADEEKPPDPGPEVEEPEPTETGPVDPTPDAEALTADRVHEWIAGSINDSPTKFGYDITAKFEGSIDQHELFSNDVVATFENLLRWYARRAGGDTPVDEVLGILLLESGLEVSYPSEALRRVVRAHGLSPDDTIAELFEAVDDEVRLPPPGPHDGGE